MFKLLIVSCLVVSLSSFAQVDAKPGKEFRDYLATKDSFMRVNDYLEDKLSDAYDIEANLEAIKKLIATESSKCKLKTLFGCESDEVKGAKSVLNLMEVAYDADKKCDQKTIEQLNGLFLVHSVQARIPELPRRLSLRDFQRIDDLLDPKLNTILDKCEKYYDESYHQRWAQLDPKVREIIDLEWSKEVLEQQVEIRHDYRIVATKLAKQIDEHNYKSVLQSQDKDAFVEYYRKFFNDYILKPCRIYRKQMNDLKEAVSALDKECNKFDIPLRDRTGDFSVGLTRLNECALMEIYRNSDDIDKMALEIFKSYARDVECEKVDWDSPTKDSLWKRLY